MDLSLKSLQVPLPEDIQKYKGHGDFTLAQKVIDQRLSENLPQILRERLELEKVILERIKGQYCYSREQALALMEETFEDVTPDDLQQLLESDAADWFYIDGELYLKNDFLNNIVKTRKVWEERVKKDKEVSDREGNFSMLDDAIREMKEKGSLAYRMTLQMTMQVKPEFYNASENISVHLPLPVEYSQVKNFALLGVSPEPTHIGHPEQKHRSIHFEGKYPQEQVFTVRFSFENHMKYVEVDPERVSDLQPTFYTEEQAPHIVFTPLIKSVTDEVVGSETNPFLKARKIYDFVTTEIIYSFMRPYITITNIPEYCITSRKGDCGVLALTFITMCRCAGIPARWQSGLYPNPLSIGNHDWAQYYVEPYGWLYADCSFGGSAYRAGNMERWDFYATNLEPFRAPFASEFQFPLYPEKKFLRSDPYDNQNGEAEYESKGLWIEHVNHTSEVLEIEKL